MAFVHHRTVLQKCNQSIKGEKNDTLCFMQETNVCLYVCHNCSILIVCLPMNSFGCYFVSVIDSDCSRPKEINLRMLKPVHTDVSFKIKNKDSFTVFLSY